MIQNVRLRKETMIKSSVKNFAPTEGPLEGFKVRSESSEGQLKVTKDQSEHSEDQF